MCFLILRWKRCNNNERIQKTCEKIHTLISQVGLRRGGGGGIQLKLNKICPNGDFFY